MQRWLFIIGIVSICLAITWPFLSKLPIGRLPGDIVIHRSNFTFYFPLTTMILISVLVSLIFYLLKK